MERENELKILDIDITAWNIGLYVRRAIVAAFDKNVDYPEQPGSVEKKKAQAMTPKDHAEQFRDFLRHYKRPVRKGGEK